MSHEPRAPRVILASQSPRRRQLLTLIGVEHEVLPADIDETYGAHEAPAPHAERLAKEKAAKIARDHPDAVVIGADTVVVVDGQLLGKPVDEDDARRMLRLLSGRTHTVHTAVAVARGATTVSAIESVEVTFVPLTAARIDWYVSTAEPMDKAGAYGVQGFGSTLVRRINGDFFAVMGLPVSLLAQMLADEGVGPLNH